MATTAQRKANEQFQAALKIADQKHRERAAKYPCRHDSWTEDEHYDRGMHTPEPHSFNTLGGLGCCR